MEKAIGAIWKKEGKKGEYMTGRLDVEELERQSGLQGLSKLMANLDIVIFTNDKQGNDKRPDYRIFISKPREDNEAF